MEKFNWVLTYEDTVIGSIEDATETQAQAYFIDFVSTHTDETEIAKYAIVEAAQWFFDENGCETMNKLQQVEFMVDYLGYSEEGAWDLVYGTDTYNVDDDWDRFYEEIPEYAWEADI